MKSKKNSRVWFKILCLILIAMMIIGSATYFFYGLLGLL